MSSTTYIYALRCPVDGEIHYVGRSKTPDTRVPLHFTDRRNPLKGRWLSMLKDRGLKPTVEILNSVVVPDDPSVPLELRWIERLRSEGEPLANNHDGSNRDKVDVDKLKELRRRRVLTIEALAAQAGVSKNTISKAERGGSIYPSSVHKIASALQVEPSDLVKTG